MIVGFRSSFLMSWSMSFYCLFIVFFIVFLSFFQLFLFFTCHLNRSLAWPLRKILLLTQGAWHLLRIVIWLSRPTGFWLSKRRNESVILIDIYTKNLSTTKCCTKKNGKFVHKLFYFYQPNVWPAMLPIMLNHEVQQANVSTFACQNVWLPTEGGQKSLK